MTERERERQTEKGKRLSMPDDAFCMLESVAEQRRRAMFGGAACGGRRGAAGGQSSLRLGMLIGGLQRQTHAFLMDGVGPPVMSAGPSAPELQCCEMPHIIVRLLTAL